MTLLSPLILLACAGKEHRPEPSESLETEILEDGSKRFVYRLEFQERQSGGRGSRGGMRGGGRGGGGSGAGSRRGRPGGGNPVEKMQERLDRALTETLEDTGYCREGYMELERDLSLPVLTISGECEETATQEDRENFPNPSEPA